MCTPCLLFRKRPFFAWSCAAPGAALSLEVPLGPDKSSVMARMAGVGKDLKGHPGPLRCGIILPKDSPLPQWEQGLHCGVAVPAPGMSFALGGVTIKVSQLPEGFALILLSVLCPVTFPRSWWGTAGRRNLVLSLSKIPFCIHLHLKERVTPGSTWPQVPGFSHGKNGNDNPTGRDVESQTGLGWKGP